MTGSPQCPHFRDVGVVDVEFGEGVTVVRPANLYRCTVGAGSFIGPFVEIQEGARVGCRCRIQSHSFICSLVTIGDDCFIGHGVTFVNDLFRTGGPAHGDRTQWRPTMIGSRVSIGSNATILPCIIADGTVVGAGAVVTRDIVERGVYAGNPAGLIRRI